MNGLCATYHCQTQLLQMLTETAVMTRRCRLLWCRTRCAVGSSHITCWRNRASVHRM